MDATSATERKEEKKKKKKKKKKNQKMEGLKFFSSVLGCNFLPIFSRMESMLHD